MTEAEHTKLPTTDIFLFFDLNLYSAACLQNESDSNLYALPVTQDPWGIDLEKTEAWQWLTEHLARARRERSRPRLFITMDLCGHEMAYLARTLMLLSDAELEIHWRGLLRRYQDGQVIHFAENEAFELLTSLRDFHRLSDSERQSLILQWSRIKNKRDAHPVFLNGQLYAARDGFLDPLIREVYEEGQFGDAGENEAISRVTASILNLRYGFNDDYVRRQVERWLNR